MDSPDEPVLARYRKYLKIEAALLIAGMLGAFILNGYAHLEKYYLVLDVPIDRLNFSAQKLAVYGGAGLSSVIAAILFMIALVFAMTMLIALSEKPGRQPPPARTLPTWIDNRRRRASELSTPFKLLGVCVALAAVAYSAWYFTVSVPLESGKNAALETAKECQERTLTFSNLDRYTACQIAESDDMFYLLKREPGDPSGQSFHTLQVPKAGLIKSEGQTQFVKDTP
ncbi:hypothetical protein [Pseudomonas sp. HY7a-MNA-CIBAN-0227]|uniref:hypothetical protein n=1 Tax=Pseudomonas sp. HY7a-MNA-CIBAN-0227 TaxID=3140474 RepID=UPI003331948C